MPSNHADTFIPCHDKDHHQILQVLAATVRSTACQAAAAPRKSRTRNFRHRRSLRPHGLTLGEMIGILIIIDSLTTLATQSTQPHSNLNLSGYLSQLLAPPREAPQSHISLVAVCHVDVPVPAGSAPYAPYAPTPLSLLSYLATTIVTVHSPSQLFAEKAAREKSLPTPLFGLNEEVEGIVIGLKPKAVKLAERGLVLELEHRRKSGRGVHEWYFLPTSTRVAITSPQASKETVILLDDHPLYRKPANEQPKEDELSGLTFELGLTERQRQDREGVVLPYFDAQKAGGGGEGGRILYDMGVEDDFDEEEDEI